MGDADPRGACPDLRCPFEVQLSITLSFSLSDPEARGLAPLQPLLRALLPLVLGRSWVMPPRRAGFVGNWLLETREPDFVLPS